MYACCVWHRKHINCRGSIRRNPVRWKFSHYATYIPCNYLQADILVSHSHTGCDRTCLEWFYGKYLSYPFTWHDVAKISYIGSFYIGAHGLTCSIHVTLYKFCISTHINAQTCIHGRNITCIRYVHLKLIGDILFYIVRVVYLNIKSRWTLYLYMSHGTAIKWYRAVLWYPGARQDACVVYPDITHSYLITPYNIFFFLLPGFAAVTWKYLSEGYNSIFWRYACQTTIRKLYLCSDILKCKDSRGVHQKKPYTEKLFQAFNISLNYNHSRY